MKLMTSELEARFLEVGNQSETINPLFIAKFFDPCGSATWYASEYDPKTKICYGYVTGLFEDEWGTFSLEELESIKRPFGLTIERDIYFNEITFHKQFPKISLQRKAELKEIGKNKNIDLER